MNRNPGNYYYEYRLADGTTYRYLPPENKDSIEAILQRLADFELPEDESKPTNVGNENPFDF